MNPGESPPLYQIFQSQKDHAQFLISQIEGGHIDALLLSSFGLWAGINNDGSDSKFSPDNPSAKVLDVATSAGLHTEVIIGIPPFTSRAGFSLPPCVYCADAHRRMLQRTFQCRKNWPLIHWFYHRENHTKLAIGIKEKTPIWAITGGHNLADSNLRDFSILLDGEQASSQLLEVFQTLRAECDPDISEIRVQFEASVQNACTPPPPAENKTPDGVGAAHGIFKQPATGPEPIRELPDPEDLESLLYALARERYLSREEFTRVSRTSSWLIDQQNGCLRPKAQEAFQDHEGIQKALNIYIRFFLRKQMAETAT